MGIIKRIRKMKAIYWSPTGRRDRNGNVICDSPVELDCRWEDVSELFMDENGNQQVSNAVIFVDRDVQVRGYLKLGELDSYISDDPLDNVGVFVIRKFENIPNLRVTEFLKVAMV